MNPARIPKNIIGGATNSNKPAKGVKGKTNATPTTARLVKKRSLLGLLFQKGDFLVLMANITRVWVHKDSMNHAVLNRGTLA